ncbi:hypothetical protein J437_LFUL002239 [Ladona fulva]|uniref:Uncharacterized protein n=1 Tax=Ladona fulva TaxID=123851 RepID=A0A8K0NYS4_LADFU|nr:hypothetical protein J437_LFUL002239 [Ladona fulva]
MFSLLFILFIWNSEIVLGTVQSSAVNDSIPIHPLDKGNAELAVKKTANIIPASEIAITSPKSVSTLAPTEKITEDLQSLNVSQGIPEKELHVTVKNDSVISPNPSKSDEKVMTEGGNSVPILTNSYQTSPENSNKVILNDGGDRGIIGNKSDYVNATSKVAQNASIISVDSNKSQSIEGISSMNKGKISARKGVNDPKITNPLHVDDINQGINVVTSTFPPHVTLKNNGTLKEDNSSSIHERLAKPLVTDGSSESNFVRIKKVDYIVPIVCTAFSVPLLIVLAVYLYKKGADFWERRHYNRMDFLIEGIYNE